jgi:hypothetical protein
MYFQDFAARVNSCAPEFDTFGGVFSQPLTAALEALRHPKSNATLSVSANFFLAYFLQPILVVLHLSV